jgi:hypothetical protein
MSPAQAEKKVGKSVATSSGFKVLISKSDGKPTLVKDSDKRKPLEFGDAESKFADFAKGGDE